MPTFVIATELQAPGGYAYRDLCGACHRTDDDRRNRFGEPSLTMGSDKIRRQGAYEKRQEKSSPHRRQSGGAGEPLHNAMYV